MSRENYIQHFIAREKSEHLARINKAFDEAEARGTDLEFTYHDLCEELNMLPLGKTCPTLVQDRKSTLDVPEDLVDAVAIVMAELKEKGSANLHEIYMEKNVPDIPLYQAFELLIAHEAAYGVSPYDLDEIGQVIHPNHTTMNLVAGKELENIKSICLSLVKTGTQTIEDHLNPSWDRPRKAYMVTLSHEKDPGKAAEHTFRILNSPEFDESRVTVGFRGPSLSTGDVVQVHEIGSQKLPHQALCMPDGWQTRLMPVEKPTVEMLGEKCNIFIALYRNNDRPALQLRTEEGAPMCSATVNIPEANLPKNHVIIKNCDENEGVAQKLENAGVGEILGEQDGLALMKITHPAVLHAIERETEKVLADQAPAKKPKPQPEPELS